MMSAAETGSKQGALGVYPDGGRSVWLLGMVDVGQRSELRRDRQLVERVLAAGLLARGLERDQHAENEAFYVLDGEVEFLKGKQSVRAEVGEFIFIPKGVVHGFKNVGQEPAKCLGIVTPGGLAEKLLTALGEPAKAETLPPPPEGPPDVERIAEIVSNYDTEMVLPPGR